GAGEVVLSASTNTATATVRSSGVGAALTLGAEHTIRGTGRVSGVFTNLGTVRGDVVGRVLAVEAATVNDGVMSSVGGATLSVESNTVMQTSAGEIVADGDGSGVSLSNTSITGGRVAGTNGGLVQVVVNSVLTDVRM